MPGHRSSAGRALGLITGNTCLVSDGLPALRADAISSGSHAEAAHSTATLPAAAAHSSSCARSLSKGAGSISSWHFFRLHYKRDSRFSICLPLRDRVFGPALCRSVDNPVGNGLKPPANTLYAGKTLHPGRKINGQDVSPAYPQPTPEAESGNRTTQHPMPRPVMGPNPSGPVPSNPGISLAVLIFNHPPGLSCSAILGASLASGRASL